MKLLMLCAKPHVPEINITNCTHYSCKTQPCKKVYPTTSLCFIFSPTPDFPHLLGFKQDPLPDPKPRTSLHLSLPPPNGKKLSSLSRLCVSPPLVEWLAGFVMLLSGILVLSRVLQGVSSYICRTTKFSHSVCPVHLSVDVVVVVHG